MRVLVTGGAGYIGSVVVEELLEEGHAVAVFDNLSTGHRDSVPEGVLLIEGDVLDGDFVRRTINEYGIEAVVHMAALSLVSESVANPAKYYRNNVAGTLSLLDAMRAEGVKRFVFSSTCAVYGEPRFPLNENHPIAPLSPYGATKLAVEHALAAYDEAYGIHSVSLRYFNAAGATLLSGERHDPESHLIPIVLDVAAGRRRSVTIHGADYPTTDGTCVRDYIHVSDLARAHVLALGAIEDKSAIYNVGCGGSGYSVRQVIETARAVTGHEIPVVLGARRAGDPARLVASTSRIERDLGWTPRHRELRTIIESAWQWMNARERVSVPAPAYTPRLEAALV